MIPRRYRKKPVEVEAVQVSELAVDWLMEHEVHFHCLAESGNEELSAIVIETLEGNMRADVGDWIIRGVQGEFYPCKPDIFSATYDGVE